MINCILTPTYEGHFKFIPEYLESYRKHVIDSHDTTIAFVLSNFREKELFDKMIKNLRGGLNIETYDIEKILRHYGITNSSEGILKKYGHTSYQTVKKIYSMLYIDAERYLVLDSEASWIKDVSMDDQFKHFFKNPFIIMSDYSTREMTDSFLKQHFEVANHLFGRQLEKMPFEHFMWYYEKSLIQDVCDCLGYPMELIEDIYNWEIGKYGKSVGLMEVMILLNYIYDNRNKYNYKVYYAEELLKEYLGADYSREYITRFYRMNDGGNIGILEFPCMMLNRKNEKVLSRLYADTGINIIRCDETTVFNERIEKRFLEAADIMILAVSQNHGFLTTMSNKEKRTRIKKDSCRYFKRKIKKLIKTMIVKL